MFSMSSYAHIESLKSLMNMGHNSCFAYLEKLNISHCTTHTHTHKYNAMHKVRFAHAHQLYNYS